MDATGKNFAKISVGKCDYRKFMPSIIGISANKLQI